MGQRSGFKENKIFDPNKNEKTTYQNLYYVAKAVLRRIFITLNAYIRIKVSNQKYDFTPIEVRRKER